MGGDLHQLRPQPDAMTRFVALDRGHEGRAASGTPGAAQPPLVTIEDIRAAADRLTGIALRTPLVTFDAGPPRIVLKAESLQSIGAFKIRGAYNAIAQLSPGDRAREIGRAHV